ncbi:MAG: NPCBM/NEW2 domain-containing protein [Pseudonocardiaceae bacterium]
MYQYAECVNKKSLIYQLDRRYDHFEATIGPSDDSQSGFSVFFTVTVDDREVLKEQVAVGESRPLRANVSGGYRMTMSVISDRPEGRCPGSGLIAVWAEPRLTPGS